MTTGPNRSFARRALLTCSTLLTLGLSGCATITGTVTGAVTGFVDLPREIIYRQNLGTDQGETWLLAIVAAPIGFVGGPVFGFIKGVGLDVGAATGSVEPGEAFGATRASIWRPYTFGWKRPSMQR